VARVALALLANALASSLFINFESLACLFHLLLHLLLVHIAVCFFHQL
jgi:hypothetical protein